MGLCVCLIFSEEYQTRIYELQLDLHQFGIIAKRFHHISESCAFLFSTMSHHQGIDWGRRSEDEENFVEPLEEQMVENERKLAA